jgi:hypothetical protein
MLLDNNPDHFEIYRSETEDLHKNIRARSKRPRSRKWSPTNTAFRVIHEVPLF